MSYFSGSNVLYYLTLIVSNLTPTLFVMPSKLLLKLAEGNKMAPFIFGSFICTLTVVNISDIIPDLPARLAPS
jgi:hypothetical protein